jgi:hypothetical protein
MVRRLTGAPQIGAEYFQETNPIETIQGLPQRFIGKFTENGISACICRGVGSAGALKSGLFQYTSEPVAT